MPLELQALMHLIDATQRQGARAAEVVAIEEEGISAESTRGRSKPVERNAMRMVLRAWLPDGRVGEVSRTSPKLDGLAEAVLAAAQKGKADTLGGPVVRFPAVTRGLGIDDRRFPQMTADERAEVIGQAEKSARSVDRRVQTRDFTYRDARTRRVRVNSNDVILEEIGTHYEATGTVTIGSVTLTEGVAGRSFSSISSLPFGTIMAKRALQLQDKAIDLSGPVRVMMPPRIVGDLFARIVLAFTHDRIESGKSMFAEALKKRRAVMDPRIHLIDDAQAPGGLRTYVFDEQGVPPIALAMLKEGIPEGRYLDLPTAAALDVRPTGHFWDGALRPSNLMLRSGTRSMSALLSEHASEALVLDHATGIEKLDLATGDVKLDVGGLWMRGNDEVLGVVRGKLVGNVLDVFSKLVDVASDTDRIGHVDAPGMLVEGWTLA